MTILNHKRTLSTSCAIMQIRYAIVVSIIKHWNFRTRQSRYCPMTGRDLKAHILWNEGIIHSVLQHGEIAEEYMLKALRLYRELGDLDGEIQALSSLAYLCDVFGRHKEATVYMRREIEKYSCLGRSPE